MSTDSVDCINFIDSSYECNKEKISLGIRGVLASATVKKTDLFCNYEIFFLRNIKF